MPTFNFRQLKKGLVELGLALATFAATYTIDNIGGWELDSTTYGIVLLVAQVALQFLRRVVRDSTIGKPSMG